LARVNFDLMSVTVTELIWATMAEKEEVSR